MSVNTKLFTRLFNENNPRKLQRSLNKGVGAIKLKAEGCSTPCKMKLTIFQMSNDVTPENECTLSHGNRRCRGLGGSYSLLFSPQPRHGSCNSEVE